MLQDDVFRFVTLRAPEQPGPDAPGFLRPPARSDWLDQLQTHLGQPDARRRIQEEAGRLRARSGHALNAKPSSLVGRLMEASPGLLHPAAPHQSSVLHAELTRRLGAKPEALIDGELPAAIRTLWDSLVVSLAAVPRDTADCQKLMGGLRAARLVELVAGPQHSSALVDIERVRTSTPILPRRLFPLPRQLSGDGAARPPGPDLNQLHGELMTRLEALHAAEQALSTLAQRFTEARPAQGSDKGRDEIAIKGELQTATSRSDEPWILGPAVARRLPLPVRRTLDQEQIAFAARPLTEVLDAVHELMAQASSKLSRVTGLARLGRATHQIRTGVTDLESAVARPVGLSHLPREPRWLDISRFDPSEVATPQVRALGIGDLQIVRQTLLKYQMGEIAHIENVLAGESKERTHRRAERTEDTALFESESESETERNLHSSERFELQREAARTVSEDTSLTAGVSISAGYGPVSTSGSTTWARDRSKERSTLAATSYARDVTERASARVKERVRQERRTTRMSEVEELNVHRLSAQSEHVIGIYRWIDKVYLAQVYNYGQRLMYEFIVPEPAAFYLWARETQSPGVARPAPESPGALGPGDIQPWNYQNWVQRYGVQDVEPPPSHFRTVGTSWSKPTTQFQITSWTDSLTVPEGYRAVGVFARYEYLTKQGVNIGRLIVGRASLDLAARESYAQMNGETGEVPIAMLHRELLSSVMTIELLCERMPETLQRWQLQTHSAIINAYRALSSAHEEQVRAALIDQEVGSRSQTPAAHREQIDAELQRQCLMLLTGGDLGEFGAMRDSVAPLGAPEASPSRARVEGERIQFFQQAFEWAQMTYLFYPYFWARKEQWAHKMQLEDADPLLGQFLRAGAARVLVPAQPGYEHAVLHYLSTGDIWEGEAPPTLDDPLFVSIAAELKARTDPPAAQPEGEPWEVTIPTTLVMLQAGADLPDFSSEVRPDGDR